MNKSYDLLNIPNYAMCSVCDPYGPLWVIRVQNSVQVTSRYLPVAMENTFTTWPVAKVKEVSSGNRQSMCHLTLVHL